MENAPPAAAFGVVFVVVMRRSAGKARSPRATFRAMPTSLRIALVQLAVVDGDPTRNVARADALVADAPDADLYLLPELWTTGYAHAAWRDAAQAHTPHAVAWMQRIARTRDAWVGGSIISERTDGGLANRCWIVSPDEGEPVCYDKAHLFAPMAEPEYLTGGGARVRTRIGRDDAAVDAAFSICYDLRFPEQYRQDALDGAELFVVPSEWPHPRSDALRLFVRARAAENQAYLALCNRTGPADDGTVFCGGSCIVAPTGDVVVDAGEHEGVVVGEIDRAFMARVRADASVLTRRVAGVDY